MMRENRRWRNAKNYNDPERLRLCSAQLYSNPEPTPRKTMTTDYWEIKLGDNDLK